MITATTVFIIKSLQTYNAKITRSNTVHIQFLRIAQIIKNDYPVEEIASLDTSYPVDVFDIQCLLVESLPSKY